MTAKNQYLDKIRRMEEELEKYKGQPKTPDTFNNATFSDKKRRVSFDEGQNEVSYFKEFSDDEISQVSSKQDVTSLSHDNMSSLSNSNDIYFLRETHPKGDLRDNKINSVGEDRQLRERSKPYIAESKYKESDSDVKENRIDNHHGIPLTTTQDGKKNTSNANKGIPTIDFVDNFFESESFWGSTNSKRGPENSKRKSY